ncbi:MAG: tRNA (adenosine(37)-N6)-threonylcarbamoyltransferase complex ATPase subunit type 1 TsaE [Alphaproteobacteria bacterium]|nr:tRNA (adenosine(37)-N6)-threonylcarbamoyltransferase complex ATPase subunit type 1 TsaE [Alphaproteobacteria bacterium]
MSATSSDSRVIALPTAAATEALGERIGAILEIGDVVFLQGPLGAGKTTLARGAVRAWTGADQETPSPTFTLAQIYDGPKGALWHMDLYRLKSADDAEELGVEEAFETAASLIEWPERLGGFAPEDRLDVALSIDGEGRRAALYGRGAWRERMHGF